MNGKEWQDRSAFNPKRLREYDENRRTNKAITPYRSFISCKRHSGHNPTDIQCTGGCHRVLPIENFSKNTRRLRKFKCNDCTGHQGLLEPNATVPAPNTLMDTAEKEEFAQARLRLKLKHDAAQAALDAENEEDESLLCDNMVTSPSSLYG